MGNDSATREAVNVRALSEIALATQAFCRRGAGPGPLQPPRDLGAGSPRRGHRCQRHHAGLRGGREALGARLPRLHLRYCAPGWNDADGLERVQRRTRNIIKELEGMIYMASLKGLHNSNNNKRSQHSVFHLCTQKKLTYTTQLH